MKHKLIVVGHLLLVIASYTSWLWLDYRILAILAISHLIMLETLRGCPLSHAQFPDDKDKRFYEWWMEKLGIRFTKVSRHRTRIFMQYILPFVLITLALFFQIVAGLKPLVSIG